MKIAVPLFGERISPRFDCAGEIIIVSTERGRIVHRAKLLTGGMTSFEKIKKLKELNIDVMICGGIDKDSEQRLLQHGIDIKPWLCGDAKTLLKQFIKEYDSRNNIWGQDSVESKRIKVNRKKRRCHSEGEKKSGKGKIPGLQSMSLT